MAMHSFFFLGVMEVLPLLVFGGGGLPLGMPPAPENPTISGVAPETCVFYTSWAAMATPDAASENRTEQLLAEPEVRRMIEAIQRQFHAPVTVNNPNDPMSLRAAGMKAAVAPAVAWLETVLTHSGTIFVENVKLGEMGMPDVRGGIVVDVAEDAAKVKEMLEKLEPFFQQLEKFNRMKQVEIDGMKWRRYQDGPLACVFGMKDTLLIVGIGDGSAEAILKRVGQPSPTWLKDLRDKASVERIATVSRIDVKTLREQFEPMAPPQVRAAIQAAGFGNVTTLTSVTGLDKEGVVSRVVLGIDGKPQGILALAEAKPLTAADLDVIPADATLALAVRADADAVLEAILGVVGAVEPRAVGDFERGVAEMRQMTGVSLRADLLKPLGDTWRIYNSPSEGGFVITGLTAVVNVDDMEKLAATNRMLVAFAKMATRADSNPRAPRIEQFKFADRDVYFFNERDDDFPLAPAWCLTDKELIVAPFPQNIKAYLSRDPGKERLGSTPEVAASLAAEPPLALGYCDTPKVFELVYPAVPFFAQAFFSNLSQTGIDLTVDILPSAPAIGKHLRPAVTTIRRTEQGIECVSHRTLPGGSVGTALPVFAGFWGVAMPMRITGRGGIGTPLVMRGPTSENNLKQIGLALHNYHDSRRRFPAAYSVDKTDKKKPLLSWRVAILPYVEEMNLYNQFHQDEPWDSPHNKALIARMPATYRSPGSQAAAGSTTYLAVRGKKTIFPGSDRVGIRDIIDGTSNTIMVVEASDAKAVPWTKPDDYEYNEEKPSAGLGLNLGGGFWALFGDGSVRLIPPNTPNETIKAYFTRNGREVIQNTGETEPRSDSRPLEGWRSAPPIPVSPER